MGGGRTPIAWAIISAFPPIRPRRTAKPPAKGRGEVLACRKATGQGYLGDAHFRLSYQQGCCCFEPAAVEVLCGRHVGKLFAVANKLRCAEAAGSGHVADGPFFGKMGAIRAEVGQEKVDRAKRARERLVERYSLVAEKLQQQQEEFVCHYDKSFEWGVEKAAEQGYDYVEPMVHWGRELLSEAGYFHSVSMLDYPERVMGGGGNFQYDREVPDQCNIIADYKDGPSVVMTNSLSNHVPADTVIRGTDGIISWKMLQGGKGKGFRVVPFAKGREEIFVPFKGQGDTSKLWRNLLDCVKTREEPACPIRMAVRVQAPLSMGILAHRENKVARFNTEKQEIVLG